MAMIYPDDEAASHAEWTKRAQQEHAEWTKRAQQEHERTKRTDRAAALRARFEDRRNG